MESNFDWLCFPEFFSHRQNHNFDFNFDALRFTRIFSSMSKPSPVFEEICCHVQFGPYISFFCAGKKTENRYNHFFIILGAKIQILLLYSFWSKDKKKRKFGDIKWDFDVWSSPMWSKIYKKSSQTLLTTLLKAKVWNNIGQFLLTLSLCRVNRKKLNLQLSMFFCYFPGQFPLLRLFWLHDWPHRTL